MDEHLRRLRRLREDALAALRTVTDATDQLKDVIGALGAEIAVLEGPPKGRRPNSVGWRQTLCYWAIFLAGGHAGGDWIERDDIILELQRLKSATGKSADPAALDDSLQTAVEREHLERDAGSRYRLTVLGDAIREEKQNDVVGIPNDFKN